MNDLLTFDLGETFRRILEIVADPASRPTEAMLIYGIMVMFVLLVLILVILLITRGVHDEDEEAEASEGELETACASDDDEEGDEREIESPSAKRRWPRTAVTALLVIAAWWAATAAMTASTPVCLTCHDQSAHALTQSIVDPHDRIRCVRCHDGGTQLTSFTTAAPRRIQHIASGLLADVPSGGYGAVDQACVSCHSADIAGVTENKPRAVKMSHREPIDAGATCTDCHRSNDGVIGVSTTKMQPCLRCHDDKTASAKCESCHTGDIALAVAGRSEPTTASAEPLVTDIDCGGCHTQESCDACHGVRLPHTQEFMDHTHARAGVEDLWYNGGRTCGKCHNDKNRPCTSCHTGKFISHGSTFRTLHTSGTSGGCDTCHASMAYRNGRDFCQLCHGAAQ